ncbi:uncharacterized protein [Haliotis asinina]|uniref:uncharacterized protein isoform X1 n=1 Tax=Haliotis asinina TaxID=109174 RepID=UPI003531F855
MDYLPILLLGIVSLLEYAVSADLCPFHHLDDIFGSSIKFKYCRHGCCGDVIKNVCCPSLPLELVTGCVAGAVVVIVVIVVLTCCFCARSQARSRHIIRTAVLTPTVFHTDSANSGLSPDMPDVCRPPPYDIVTSELDKPPSYEEIMRNSPEYEENSAHGK